MWGGGGGVRRARGRAPSPSCGCFQEEEEEVPRKKEKMVFSVRLTELKAADKVKLIKEVKNFVPGVNLVQVRRALPTRTAPAALGPLPGTGRLQSTLRAAGLTSLLERDPGFHRPQRNSLPGGCVRTSEQIGRDRAGTSCTCLCSALTRARSFTALLSGEGPSP